MKRLLGVVILSGFSTIAMAMMDHSRMVMDEHGMIMNANPSQLPRDCREISEEVHFEIRAGRQHAQKFPGRMFAFSAQQWRVKPCAKLNITFINDDPIRHQFMLHGLPGYLYPDGMFHMELYGKGQLTASFIVPSQNKTYLAHCEVPQHMEKGMKAQLIVGEGSGDLPSIPGISAAARADAYPVAWSEWSVLSGLVAVLVGVLLPWALERWQRPSRR